MIKILFALFCIVTMNLAGNAQKKLPVPGSKKIDSVSRYQQVIPSKQLSSNIIIIPGIVVYERPNFMGRQAPFLKNAQGKFEFPFPLDHVSIKVPDGVILYIKTCFEFPAENAYITNQLNINLNYICGVRTDQRVYVSVDVGGFSTEIHNRDCSRFDGNIVTKMWEKGLTAADAIEISMPATSKATPTSPFVTRGFSHTLFNHGTGHGIMALNSSSYQGFELFVHNNNPVPVLTMKANNLPHMDSGSRRTRSASGGYQFFCVGQNAIREGRVKLEVKTNLMSSHKSCDLCTDYSSIVKMANPVTTYFPINKSYDGGRIINASHPYVIAGPYEARPYLLPTASHGSLPDTYSTLVKHFRVHLIIGGL